MYIAVYVYINMYVPMFGINTGRAGTNTLNCT